MEIPRRRKFDLSDDPPAEPAAPHPIPPEPEKILIPASWQWACPGTLRAISEQDPKLERPELLARVTEATDVDRRVRATHGWLNDRSRDDYLASIIRGNIRIGS